MGGHGHLNPKSGPEYNFFRAPVPSTIQRKLAVSFGAMAWFWVMFRFSKDWRFFSGQEFHFGGAHDQEFDLDEFAFYEGDEELLPKF